jgi:hypothetical protein
MPLKKPLTLWIWGTLFAVSVATTPLACRLLRRPADPPSTLTELAGVLSQCTPPLHVVRQFEDRPEVGLWIYTSPQYQGRLWGLCRSVEHAERWQGIVFCELVGEKSVITEQFIRDNWREYAMRIGPLLFFGDPEVLQRIRQAIHDRQGNRDYPGPYPLRTERGAEVLGAGDG